MSSEDTGASSTWRPDHPLVADSTHGRRLQHVELPSSKTLATERTMTKSCYYYLLMTFVVALATIFSLVSFPHVITFASTGLTAVHRTLRDKANATDVCDSTSYLRPNAPVIEFTVEVDATLDKCFIPETDSRNIVSIFDTVWRYTWVPFYRLGCSAPSFSRINRTSNTLIIDCPASMEPKYSFRTRTSGFQNYLGPVSMEDHEWVYTRCNFPLHASPTTRIHFHARPLPQPAPAVSEKPNVVFLQFDALGRQAMYRRLPRSYELLTSFKDAKSKKLIALRNATGIELRYLNVNGRNSEPNMRRLYCGSGNCQTTSLLRLYKRAGYATSLLESYSYQLPNYIPSNAVDRVLASNYFTEFGGDTVELYNKRSGCVMNTTWIADVMFDYLRDRFVAMRAGGWFAINNMVDPHSIDELNNFAVLDTKFRDFLLSLNESRALDNTILIILGDHGLHGYDWKELWREYDHRNPPLYILIGKNVSGAESIVKNLQVNSDKLIGHGDIYMTIAHFANVSLPLVLSNTYDLFTEKIPSRRTCRSARIPDEWCNCWKPKRQPC